MTDKRTPPGSGAGPKKGAGESDLSVRIIAIRVARAKAREVPSRNAEWRDGDLAEPFDDLDDGPDDERP
jgi:hypothetical protein